MNITVRPIYFSSRSVLAIALFIACSIAANAQGMRVANAAQAASNETNDNARILDGVEKDKAARRNKEERMAVVNTAFKRLQILHNEFMTMMSSSSTVENSRIVSTAEEIRLRAVELNANLALPELPKDKSKESIAGPDLPLSEQMAAVCSHIRDFVKNVNASPTDPKAGIQARLDLKAIIGKSDKVIALTNAAGTKKQ